MLSFKTTVFIAASIALVQTQSIDPSSVPLTTREGWCTAQTGACPELCLQINSTVNPDLNNCNATTLVFDCGCNNGLSPNSSQFSLTIPYFECVTFGDQCVAGCNQDNACESACRANNPCGAQNPTRINATASPTSAGSSATGSSTSGVNPTQVFSGIAGASSTGSSSSSASSSGSSSSPTAKSAGMMVVDAGASYGLAVVFASLFAGFALL